jgi:hypothetical protein
MYVRYKYSKTWLIQNLQDQGACLNAGISGPSTLTIGSQLVHEYWYLTFIVTRV